MPARKEELPDPLKRDAGKSKRELYEDAREADIEGRSRMDKEELARALQRHYDRETDRARR